MSDDAASKLEATSEALGQINAICNAADLQSALVHLETQDVEGVRDHKAKQRVPTASWSSLQKTKII